MTIKTFLKKYGLSVLSVIIFIFLWEVGSRLGILPVDYIGTPSKIFFEFTHMWTPDFVNTYFLPSIEELFIGLAISIAVGTVFGFLIGINSTVRQIFKPFFFAINTVPVMVFFPLFIIAFGISLQTVIIAIVVTCAAPIMINVAEGVANTDPLLLGMAKSFNAKGFFVFKEVLLGSTLPYLFAGIKSGVGRAIIALIIAELYGLNKGIGYLISFYGSGLHTDKLMAIVLLILLLNCIIFSMIWLIERNLYEEKRISNFS